MQEKNKVKSSFIAIKEVVCLNDRSLLQTHPEEPPVCSHSRFHAGGEFTDVGDCPDGLTKGWCMHTY